MRWLVVTRKTEDSPFETLSEHGHKETPSPPRSRMLKAQMVCLFNPATKQKQHRTITAKKFGIEEGSVLVEIQEALPTTKRGECWVHKDDTLHIPLVIGVKRKSTRVNAKNLDHFHTPYNEKQTWLCVCSYPRGTTRSLAKGVLQERQPMLDLVGEALVCGLGLFE